MEISKKISLEEYCKGVEQFYNNLKKSVPYFDKLKKNVNDFCKYSTEYSKKILEIGNNIPNDNSFAGGFCNIVRNMIFSICIFFSDTIPKITNEIKINNPPNFKKLKEDLNTIYSRYKSSGQNVIDDNTKYNQYIEKYENYLLEDEITFAKNDINKNDIKESYLKQRVRIYNQYVSQTKEELNKLLELANPFSDGCKNICNTFLVHMKEAIEKLKKCPELANSSFIRINEEIKNLKKNMEFKNYKYPLLSLKIYLNNHGQIKTENYLEKNKGITLETIEKIIENLKNNKIEINDEDLENFEKEKAKKIFREKCSLLTSSDKTIEEIDKDKIIKYITKEGEYPSLFLAELNETRDKNLISNDDTFNFFSEIITIINDIAVKRDNYELFQNNKNIGITFFKIDDNNKKKIYLNYSFKNNEKLNSLDFWLKYASYFIRIEEKKRKYKKPLYLIISDSARDMIDSGFDLKFMNDFIEAAIERFNISQQEKDNIKKNMKEFLDTYTL